MATDSKDVELRVRARDYSQKTLEGVTKALKELGDAQEDQLASAAKGETSAKSLEASYRKIEGAVKALLSQNALTKTFESQAKALDEAKRAADEARTSHTAYANSMAGSEKVTKAQQRELTKLATAVTRADAAQLRQQTTVDRTVAKLQSFGIAANDVAGAQAQIARGVAVGNAALDRQAKALDEVEGNIKRKADSDRQAAQAAVESATKQAAADREMADATRRAADVERMWHKLLNERDEKTEAATKADRAMADSMRKSADQAQAAAKGYQTLARSVSSVRGDELARQIKGIADPAGVAMGKIDGLEATIKRLEDQAKNTTAPVKNFKQAIQDLESAQKGIGGIAAQIDGYRRQMDTLRAARTEYSKAQAAVRELTKQMRAGGGDAGELAKQLTAANSRLQTAANSMAKQTGTTRVLRENLRAAGVDTRNMGAAQQQLVGQAQRATGAINTLTGTYQKYGVAAEKAGRAQMGLFSGGRTTLSWAQRLRGEVLALATAYVGLQGGINLARGALDAYRKTQQINSQLGAVVGMDSTKIKAEWDYLLETANRIGFEFEKAAGAYAKFSIAAKAAGLDQQETRYVFERFAEAARVAGQSGDEFEGVLKAIEQMMSKGTIQAEELRGQLGDRLPGAFSIAAKAANMTTAEFSKMMEQGAIGADYVINIARELGNTYEGIDQATKNLQANEARFRNAAFTFQKAIADGGFAQAYQQFMLDLAELLNSPQGAQLAQTLSTGFTAVVRILKFAVDNLDLVKAAFIALTGVAAVTWIAGLVRSVGTLVTAFTALRGIVVATTTMLLPAATAATGLGGAMTGAAGGVGILAGAVRGLRIALLALSRLVPVLAAAWAAYEAGNYLVDKFSNKPSEGGASGSWGDPVAPGSGAGSMATPDPGTGGTAGKQAALALQKTLAANQTRLDKQETNARLKGAKKELEERKSIVQEQYDAMRVIAESQIEDADDLAKALADIDKQAKQAMLIEERKFQNDTNGAAGAGANKRVQLEQQVRDELLRIQADIQNSEVAQDPTASFEERLQARLDKISQSYTKLKKTIEKFAAFDKAGAAAARDQLNVYIEQLKLVEANKVAKEEVTRLDKDLTNEQSLRTTLIERENALYESGQISRETMLQNIEAINARVDGSITTAANNLKAFAEANGAILTELEKASIATRADTAIATSSNTDNTNREMRITSDEAAINRLLQERAAQIDVIQAKREQGLIGETEYAERVNATNLSFKDTILSMTQGLAANAQAMLLAGGLSEEQSTRLTVLIDKMRQLGVETSFAKQEMSFLQASFSQFLNDGLDTALNGVADALTNMASGQQSVSEGFRSMLQSSLEFFASFMMDIAKAIIKQMLLNALAGAGGWVGVAATAAGGVSGGVRHSGGKVGKVSNRTRTVNPGWFANAPRFHNGGLPGLKADEVPSILQTGEEVLSRNDPRNVLNGAGGGGGTAAPSSNRFVLVDDRSKVAEAMQSAEGEEVTMVHLKRNIATIKQWVK